MAVWFYQHNGKPIGPISDIQMHEWVKAKSIGPTQLVRQEDAAEWKMAGAYRELFPDGFTVESAPDRIERSEGKTVGRVCSIVVFLVGLPFIVLALFVAHGGSLLGAVTIAGPGLGFLALLIWCLDLSDRLATTAQELRTLRKRIDNQQSANHAMQADGAATPRPDR